ncbi:MAG TPA: DUF4097 family beta strand repeat-containing protein, partial [Thermomicrobiales bacterium]|nr:DUF4097 family beta strand repeat-containing protein [Thermomicrobiales bacterium]
MNNDSLMPLDGSRITSQDVPLDSTQPLALSVTNASGDIDITTSDRQDIRVIAERTDNGRHDEDARIVIDAAGNKISVHPNWQIGNTIGEIARKVKHQLKEGFNSDEWDLKNMKFGMNAKFDIHIELPRHLAEGSSVSVKDASGDVSVTDVTARISAATANGDVELSRLDGRVSAHSASGDIALTNVTGSIEANTANGNITVSGGEAWTALRAVNGNVDVNGLTMKNARITTVSGDIDIKATLNNAASYTFDTVSGDIGLTTTLPASGASLNYKAVSGDVSVNGDWTKGSGKRSWQLAGGNEGPDIRVKAVSGDLRAKAISDPGVTLQHETAAPAPEPNEPEGTTDTETAAPDFDWEKARGWVSSITQKISQVINDMDEPGAQKTPPTPPAAERPAPPVPPAADLPVPPAPPTPGLTGEAAETG